MLPKGIVATGFPRVQQTCRRIGIEFDPWQVDLNKCVLAKGSDGLAAAAIIGISIPRQVGKTFDIGAVVFAECIAEPGTTVVWTAHHFKVARETFNELRALAKSPKLAPHIDYDSITTGAGNEIIPFRNGSRIVFAARERGAIRGFSKVRILVLDEAQILTEEALSDMAPTQNQAVNPLIILMGTPPKPDDPSEVFTRVRTEALTGQSEDILWVEFGAKPGCDPDDREAWKEANPSFPTRTPARALLRLRKLLSLADWLREVLGVWDDDSADQALPKAAWRACGTAESSIDGRVFLAAAMTPDRSTVSLAAAGRRSDGLLHVEIVFHGPAGALYGREQWSFVPAVAAVAGRQGAAVTVVPQHPIGSLVPDLEKDGARVTPLTPGDYTRGCGAFYDDVTAQRLRYIAPQPELDAAIGRASRKASGDAWRWAGDDISALVAATQAAQAVRMAPVGGSGRVIALS